MPLPLQAIFHSIETRIRSMIACLTATAETMQSCAFHTLLPRYRHDNLGISVQVLNNIQVPAQLQTRMHALHLMHVSSWYNVWQHSMLVG